MKMWKEVLVKGMPFNMVQRTIIKSTCYYTRPEWEGVHFWSLEYGWCILLKDGKLLTEVLLEKVESKDKDDWMAVSITDEAVKIIVKHFTQLNKIYIDNNLSK